MAVKDGLPATDFSRMNREWVKAVAEGGSGGGGLPEITEADEGKFLGVVSGEAAWATAGGGSSPFEIVTISNLVVDESDSTVYIGTADKTAIQLIEAYQAGKILACYIPSVPSSVKAWSKLGFPGEIDTEEGYETVVFNNIIGDANDPPTVMNTSVTISTDAPNPDYIRIKFTHGLLNPVE